MNTSNAESIKWHIQVVFLYYASYADRNNCRLLKSQNYRRFLIDSEAVKQQAAFPPFDIAFRKVHPSSITLPQFQELIPNIATIIYPHKSRSQSFQLFMAKNLTKLFKEILEKSEFGADVAQLETVTFEEEAMALLESTPLHRAYSKYIEATSMHQRQPQQTFEQIYTLLNEFDLCPKLTYKAMAYLAFLKQLRQSYSPNRYHLEQLKQLLVCIAELSWRRTHTSPVQQVHKVLRVLQQMEVSPGFQKMIDKSLKENNMAVSFFSRQEGGLAASFDMDQLHNSRQKRAIEGEYSSRKNYRSQGTARMTKMLQQGQDGQNVGRMRELFGRLCSHGEVGNTKTLKSIKIKRFFQGHSILGNLSHDPWLDITITELTRQSSSGKVQFPQWVELLRLTADRLNLDHRGFTQYLFDNSTQLNLLHSRLQSDRPSQHDVAAAERVLWQVERPLAKIFKHFSKGSQRLDFQQLSHLLYEFDVFPGLVSKSKSYHFFQQYSSGEGMIGQLVGKVFLDLKGLVLVLAQIAGQAGQSLSELQRVLFLLQKMQDSQGHRRVLGRTGSNLIGDLRAKYSSVYLGCNTPPQPVQDFQSLLSDYASYS